MFGPSKGGAWGGANEAKRPLLDAAADESDAAEAASAAEAGVVPPPAQQPPHPHQPPTQREQDAAAVHAASAVLAESAERLRGLVSAVAAAAAAPPAPPPPQPALAPDGAFRFPGFRRAQPQPPAAAQPATGRIQRAARFASGFVPNSIERSILAYAALQGLLGLVGILCIPSFPLFWRCAGILPLLSLLLLAGAFGAAFVVALLPEPANLYPAAMLVAAMAGFYFLRLTAADGLKVFGLSGLGDLIFLIVSLAELVVLAKGVSNRRSAARLRLVGY